MGKSYLLRLQFEVMLYVIRWGSFESPDKIYEEVEMLRALEIALKTWSDWLEFHINRTKTKIYFVSRSPTHERYEEN